MRKLDINEIKERALEILIDTKNVCEHNHIDYYLAYGTLIGAVRHQGFIPWDDDIDIWIPIKQYKQFIEAMKKESRFHIIDYSKDMNWGELWCKVEDPKTLVVDKRLRKNQEHETVRGLAIDVFPLFESSNDNCDFDKVLDIFNKFTRFWNYQMGRSGLKTKIYCGVLALFGRNATYYRMKLIETITSSKGDYYRIIGPSFLSKRCYCKTDFEGKTTLQFEKFNFDAPIGYDAVLRQEYGDYMTPPPVSEQEKKHSVDIFEIENEDRNEVIKECCSGKN